MPRPYDTMVGMSAKALFGMVLLLRRENSFDGERKTGQHRAAIQRVGFGKLACFLARRMNLDDLSFWIDHPYGYSIVEVIGDLDAHFALRVTRR